MTTTVAPPQVKPGQSEIEERPSLGRDLADTTRQEPDTRPFDPMQGRKIGSHPYDDATQGRKIGSDPYDDATRGR